MADEKNLSVEASEVEAKPETVSQLGRLMRLHSVRGFRPR